MIAFMERLMGNHAGIDDGDKHDDDDDHDHDHVDDDQDNHNDNDDDYNDESVDVGLFGEVDWK